MTIELSEAEKVVLTDTLRAWLDYAADKYIVTEPMDVERVRDILDRLRATSPRPMTCDHVDRVALHPSIRVGGFAVGKCGRKALPGMVVCAWHATPEAVTMRMESLAKKRSGK